MRQLTGGVRFILLLAFWWGASWLRAANLSPLAPAPNWHDLDRFQETITREEFIHLLESVYAPNQNYAPLIASGTNEAEVQTGDSSTPIYRLRFAPGEGKERPVATYWNAKRLNVITSGSLPPAETQPLAGLKIAIDPGHLGGEWARMEERWFQIGNGTPVAEGSMTLRVAELLRNRLTLLGATVYLVRGSEQPITKLRPPDLRSVARAELERLHIVPIQEDYSGPADPLRHNSIRWESEVLFYRTAEIRARADRVNEELKPDLVICLHFNAEPWGDPANPALVESNHLHLIVNGAYTSAELSMDDVRFEMLQKLLSRTAGPELAISDAIAPTLAAETGLPPYHYTSANAVPVGTTGYVWMRNLLANRLYHCPVIYLEPYVMNSAAVYEWIQAGDYPGTRNIGGREVPSIYREYANAVADGLAKVLQPVR